MATLTICLPDDTAARLKALARSRGMSVNKLVEELIPTDESHDSSSRDGGTLRREIPRGLTAASG